MEMAGKEITLNIFDCIGSKSPNFPPDDTFLKQLSIPDKPED
jgi:hypothetical protein